MVRFKDVYDYRWKYSYGTRDDDILVFKGPRTQVEFFYLNYNRFIAAELKTRNPGIGTLRILELGCGRATSSIYLQRTMGSCSYAMDYSFEALRIATKNATKYGAKVSLLQGDVYNLPLQEGSVDAVISLGLMEHVEEPDDAFKEMLRVLRKNGTVISMNVPESPDNIQRIAAPVNRSLYKVGEYLKLVQPKPWLDKGSRSKTDSVYRSQLGGEGFKAVVEKAGFGNVVAYEANPFPTFEPLPKWLNWVVTKSYQSILTLRRILYRHRQPLVCDKKNSRVHFVIGTKG